MTKNRKVISVEGKNGGLGEVDADQVKVGLATYKELFRFASWFDILCMIVGCIAAGCVGAAQPCFMIIFGDVMDGAGGLDGTGSELRKVQNNPMKRPL